MLRVTKSVPDRSWRIDETYVKVKGEWVYLYRVIGKHGKTLDFMLSKRRNKAAATKFFARALEASGLPFLVLRFLNITVDQFSWGGSRPLHGCPADEEHGYSRHYPG